MGGDPQEDDTNPSHLEFISITIVTLLSSRLNRHVEMVSIGGVFVARLGQQQVSMASTEWYCLREAVSQWYHEVVSQAPEWFLQWYSPHVSRPPKVVWAENHFTFGQTKDRSPNRIIGLSQNLYQKVSPDSVISSFYLYLALVNMAHVGMVLCWCPV